MFQSTKQTYVPSQGKFLKFREFTNGHLFAMTKSSHSQIDSITCQLDTLKDLYADTIDFDFTVLDLFTIFLDWRISNIDAIITIEQPDKNITIDLSDWYVEAQKLKNVNWASTLSLEVLDINLNIPKVSDILEMHKDYALIGDVYQRRLEENVTMGTLLLFDSIGDNKLDYGSKKELFENLPLQKLKELEEYSKSIHDKLKMVNINMGGLEDRLEFSFELIPILIQNLFGGSFEDIIETFLLTNKKTKLSLEEYMNMTPLESRYSIEFMLNQEQNQKEQGPSDEDMFAAG